MYLKELQVLAKNNDDKAKKELIKHYESMFIKNVKKYHSNADDKNIKEAYLNFIEQYLKSDYNMCLQGFLYFKARSFGHNREMMIGNKVDINDKDKINYVINHYSKTFFDRIKNYEGVLTKEELEVFSYEFIKKLFSHKYNCNNDIRVIMVSYIAIELKIYKENIDDLYKRYILCVGLNDKIINYFSNKYTYLLDELKQNPKQILKYNYLKFKYKEIIVYSLNNIPSMSCNIDLAIKKNLEKEYKNYKDNKNSNIKDCNENKDDLLKKYSYIKEKIYDKFESEIAYGNENLKKEINKKYNEYFNVYLNGNSNSNIPKYLNTRLTDYFNRQKTKVLPNNSAYKDEEYYLYINYVEKYLNELNTNFPYECARNILIETYNEIYKKYFYNDKKTNIIPIFQLNLKKKINILNINYSDKNIYLMKEYYKKTIKENNLIEENVIDDVIDNLTNYYLNLKMNNNKPYEIFIMENIKNFNYKKYVELENIKEESKITNNILK